MRCIIHIDKHLYEGVDSMSYSFGEFALLFKALSDETRLRIISQLSEQEKCACEILDSLSITQPTLSYHMKMLTESGLVKGRKDGSWMRYTVNGERIEEMQKCLETIRLSKEENTQSKKCSD